MVKHLGYMKLRPEMVAPLNDLIWINDSGLDFLKCNFRNLLKYVAIRVYRLGLKGIEKVHSDFPLKYERVFYDDGHRMGYTPAYVVRLNLDDYGREMFDIYYECGTLRYMYTESKSVRHNDDDIPTEIKAFLSQIYDDVREIHSNLLEV